MWLPGSGSGQVGSEQRDAGVYHGGEWRHYYKDVAVVEHDEGKEEDERHEADGETPGAEASDDQLPPARREAGSAVVAFSLLTNVAAATCALTGSAFTESAALLGAGLLAAADSGAQIGLLAGRRHDRRLQARSAALHPLDTRMHRLFWFFAAGVVLMTLAGVAALSVGADRLAESPGSTNAATAVQFAAGALAAKLISLVVTANSVRRVLPSASQLSGAHLVGYLLRTSQPEPAVVIRQDTLAVIAQFAALITAIAAATIHLDTDIIDAVGAMAVGGLLIVGAVLHVVQLKTMLVADPAGGHHRQSITAAVEIEPSVVRLVHLEVYHLGPQELLVGAKVELIGDLHTSELTDTIKRLADSIRRAVPTACVVYVEPDAPSSTPLAEAGPLGPAGVFASGGTYLLDKKAAGSVNPD